MHQIKKEETLHKATFGIFKSLYEYEKSYTKQVKKSMKRKE
jgi:hypothetical protein